MRDDNREDQSPIERDNHVAAGLAFEAAVHVAFISAVKVLRVDPMVIIDYGLRSATIKEAAKCIGEPLLIQRLRGLEVLYYNWLG